MVSILKLLNEYDSNSKNILLEKFNLHPFYDRIYNDVERMFHKRLDKIELLRELNNILEGYGNIIQDTFKRKDYNVSLDVTCGYSQDFNASFLSTTMNVDGKQVFYHKINMDIFYSNRLKDYLQGDTLRQIHIDYYAKTITSNFLHEMEHSIQEINISDLSKLGLIKTKQSPLNVYHDLKKYYSSNAESDSYAADTARELLHNIKDVTVIKKNLNNVQFMKDNAGSNYPIYKELKDSDTTVWKRFLRRIYQYLDEMNSTEINHMYMFLMNDAKNLGLKISNELMNNNITYRDYAKNSDNFQFLMDNSQTFKQKYALIVNEYPKVWKKVDSIIFDYLKLQR